ncbi:MAG: MoxR family ATPase [Armatimonadetes bacterium]|nr:MoxR family ATPase [Armatimonadota bacterium]
MVARGIADRVIANVERVIVGKRNEVKLLLVALLSEGHVLVEDVPGVGKTMLARAMARSLGCSFKRIQFTPDLLPSDILGVTIFNQKTSEFEFRPGPVVSQIILADEINRGTPKTQSALLECMEERQITVDGATRLLPKPFMVIATQNPIEYRGTFPLPESQLDRFLLRIVLGYPDPSSESEILIRQQLVHPIEEIRPVLALDELLDIQGQVKKVHVSQDVREYIVQLVQATRKESQLFLGSSPRGSLALFKSSQALALLEGRDFVIPDDVKQLVPCVLGHRLIARGEQDGLAIHHVLTRLLDRVPIPKL